MKFFELEPAFRKGFWGLADPYNYVGNWISPHLFTIGMPWLGEGEITIKLSRPGLPLDFTFASQLMPVVGVRIGKPLAAMLGNAIQLIDAVAEGQSSKHFILNCLRVIDCFDEKRTEGWEKYTSNDGNPLLTGHYKSSAGMKIKYDSVQGEQLFRVKGTAALICSESIRDLLVGLKVSGVSFTEV